MKQDTKGEITVERSVSTQRDASIIAIGITGTIIGRRWTGAILDDFQDFDSTWTHEQRTKLKKILESTVLNRVVGNGFVLDVGTPWHVEDARHWLRKLPGFHFERFDANDMLWPDEWTDPQTGITWGWTKERLEDKRKRMSELEWNRQFRCVSSSGSFAIFSTDALSACLDRGRGLRLSRTAPDGRPVVTGIDLAIKKQDSADKTVFVTGCVNEGGVKEILEIRAGHWELTEIARQVLDTLRRYPNHYGFRVESNAAQAYMLQALTSPTIMKALGATDNEIGNIRIYSHYTGPKKYDPMVGIRSLAADFDHQRVKLPCSKEGVPEGPVDELITGLISFDPMAHTSDYVMAYYLFVEMTRKFWTETAGGFADLGVW